MYDLYPEDSNDEWILEKELSKEDRYYALGEKHGLSGLDPSPILIKYQSYWAGYEVSLRFYWLKKYKVNLPQEF